MAFGYAKSHCFMPHARFGQSLLHCFANMFYILATPMSAISQSAFFASVDSLTSHLFVTLCGGERLRSDLPVNRSSFGDVWNWSCHNRRFVCGFAMTHWLIAKWIIKYICACVCVCLCMWLLVSVSVRINLHIRLWVLRMCVALIDCPTRE